MTINVIENDIENGNRGVCGSCPIALALSRETGLQWIATHSYLSTYVDVGESEEKAMMIPTPEVAYGFMIKFDRGQEVKPFSFEINYDN